MAGRSCLVSVYGSGNALAAIASVRSYGIESGAGDPTRVVVLLHPPVSAATAAANAAVVERLIGSQGWDPPVLLAGEDLARLSPSLRRGASLRRTIRRFTETYGTEFDEIHFAHDMVKPLPELAMNAYPNAKRIVYGDALGSVYDTRYFMALAEGGTIDDARRAARGGSQHRSRTTPRSLARRVRDGLLGKATAFAPDAAVLVLPMDQTGRALAGTPFSVVPKQLMLDILAQCTGAVPELAAYARATRETTRAPRYLLLLENYADADMTGVDDELAMYEAVVRRHAPAGATVLLKPHPLAVAPIADRLTERLATDYAVHAIPAELGRYPMELWAELLSSCEVISMLSYCGISLAFLLGKQTIYPIDTSLIERYFPPRSWDRMNDSDVLYRGQLANLAAWDGRGILWKGEVQ